MRGRIHSREFKLQLCKQAESGQKRPSQICREHHLSESLFSKWRKEFHERGEAAFTPLELADQNQQTLLAKIEQMERFIGQQALEISTLKKVLEQLPSIKGTK